MATGRHACVLCRRSVAAHALLTRTNRTTSASHASVLAKLWAQCNFVLWHVVPSDDEPSGSDVDEHNVWSRVLGLCFHFDFGERFQDCLAEVELERLTLACYFTLDHLCASGPEPSQQVRFGGLVFGRTPRVVGALTV